MNLKDLQEREKKEEIKRKKENSTVRGQQTRVNRQQTYLDLFIAFIIFLICLYSLHPFSIACKLIFSSLHLRQEN